MSSHFSGGAALVWNSRAPCRRRCAPEAWDDAEVIPPLGTKEGVQRASGTAEKWDAKDLACLILGYERAAALGVSVLA